VKIKITNPIYLSGSPNRLIKPGEIISDLSDEYVNKIVAVNGGIIIDETEKGVPEDDEESDELAQSVVKNLKKSRVRK